MLRCPDLELARLTPANIADLLFDEIMWAERARVEHQAFADVLGSRGVEVFQLADLLATALADEGGRKELLGQVQQLLWAALVGQGGGQQVGQLEHLDPAGAEHVDERLVLDAGPLDPR